MAYQAKKKESTFGLLDLKKPASSLNVQFNVLQEFGAPTDDAPVGTMRLSGNRAYIKDAPGVAGWRSD